MFQMLVPGGTWKATWLESGKYGLLSEVVSPGFEFDDMTLATEEEIRPLVGDTDWEFFGRFCKPE